MKIARINKLDKTVTHVVRRKQLGLEGSCHQYLAGGQGWECRVRHVGRALGLGRWDEKVKECLARLSVLNSW